MTAAIGADEGVKEAADGNTFRYESNEDVGPDRSAAAAVVPISNAKGCVAGSGRAPPMSKIILAPESIVPPL